MKICTVDACNRSAKAGGLCNGHYERKRQGLPYDQPLRGYERGERVCKVEGCGQPRGCHGTYCDMHLRRLERHGQAGTAERQRSRFGEAVWQDPDVHRTYRLRAAYGLTAGQYDEMLAAQGGRCAICGTTTPANKRAKAIRAFCVDHDHTTARVRGLLCGNCNRALGMFGDSPDVLRRAIEYLERE